MVAISTVLHLFGLGVAVSKPAPRYVAPPQAIAVELVSDPGKSRKPAPVSRPSPPKPKPKPRPAKTVLPEKPRGPEPEAKPRTTRREEVFLDPAPKEEKSLDDLLADFREEQGEPTEAPAPTPQPVQTAAVPSPGTTTGVRISPEVADWMRRTKLHVKKAWVVEPGFRIQSLTTHVTVRLDAGGHVMGEPEVTKRSGNPWYDESVVRGIVKASPLPKPPVADDWAFIFTPEDSY